MRMRRKKHLAERLGGVDGYLIPTENDILDVRLAVKEKRYIDFNEIFGNGNPVFLEIGCGRGGFITELAKAYREINFLAVELIANVIVLACEKVKEQNLSNVRFLNTGAEYLPRYIKDGSISAIFLNFSPPYPQKTHENRRLTNDVFLNNYAKMLNSDGKIYQKTDDADFFAYSLESFSRNGFAVTDLSKDKDLNEFAKFRTEYENKFLAKNMHIYSLVAKKML